MSGAALKLLVILPVLAGFVLLVIAVQRRNRNERNHDKG